VPILRSWLKQERAASSNRRWGSPLRIGTLLLIALVGLEALRRVASSREQVLKGQNEKLELLQWIARDTSRPLRDWANWDVTYHYVIGSDPAFLARDMQTTALLDGGAVLAIFNGANQLQALSGADSQDRSSRSLLNRCLADLARLQQRSGRDTLPVICPSERGPLVGGIATITDTDLRNRTDARLLYLVPLLTDAGASSIQTGLADLSHELLLTPESTLQADQRRSVAPTLWTSGGQPLQVQQPASGAKVRNELLALAALVGSGLLLSLALRVQWMLTQRRQRLEQRRRDQRIAQRIRHTERELTQLLDSVQGGGEANESMAFARLLARNVPGLPAGGDLEARRVERLAERFELVLQTARSLALLDPITSLPNRSYFLERLSLESDRSRSQHRSLALLFINIDKFKQINETYGHTTGDAVLQHVAKELNHLIEPGDFLARFGGDEFSLILHTDNLDDSREETLRHHAHERALALLDGFQASAGRQPEQIKLSLSIGIAISDPAGTTPEELIRRSDMAMVMAKTRRQQRVSVFDIESDWDSLNNYRLFNALQSDISHAPERFQILFQPIVDSSGQMCKVEALCRWHNPDFPDVPADVFFALAERYRLIHELGRLILDITLKELQLLRQQLGRSDLGLALNISPSQLSQQGFGTWLLGQFSQRRIQADSVTVEVTESAVVETSLELTDNLDALRNAGVALALDDFGTGFSSLRLLMWLKPDELKIDKSFVVAASQDPVALQIVRLLQSLTQEMELLLVAEGVEDESVLQVLRQAGLERFQGYLFSRPLNRTDLVARQRERAAAPRSPSATA
jgi:diguanylate cyclase (GGDEF)-like protein